MVVDKETLDAVGDHVRRNNCVVVDTMPSTITDLRDAEFQIVAWCEETDEMAFVRVLHCSSKNPDPTTLVGTFKPTAERMRKAKRDARKWCRNENMGWKGAVRFDRIEVYGAERRVFDWTRNVKGKL